MRRKSRKWAKDPDNDSNLRNGMAIRLDETYTTYRHRSHAVDGCRAEEKQAKVRCQCHVKMPGNIMLPWLIDQYLPTSK